MERERSVRACGVGRRATGGRCIGAAAAHIRVSLVSAQVGRVIGAPVSRRRQGRGAAHRRRLGRARVPSGVAAAGHVWGHRSALEVFALHLPPNLCNGAAAVSNEGEVWSGAVAAVCSDGRRGGGCRVGRTSFGPPLRCARPQRLANRSRREAWSQAKCRGR